MKKRIALIFGGEGKESHISELSGANLAALMKEKYELICIGIKEDGTWNIFTGEIPAIADSSWRADKNLIPTFPVLLGKESGFLSEGKIIPVDLALPCLHGDFGEDGIIQGALKSAHITYVGQDVYASAVSSDKGFCKLFARKLGIPTAKWCYFTDSDTEHALSTAEKELCYPMFIKPARLGSSIGAQMVKTRAEFARAFEDARTACGGPVLVEEAVAFAYELECAFLMGKLSPNGIVMPGDNFYSYDKKYGGKNLTTVAAPPKRITRRVTELSERLIKYVGIKQLSRIDFFVTENGRIYFNEINVFPGMTPSSLYPALTEEMGLSRGEFIDVLVNGALS